MIIWKLNLQPSKMSGRKKKEMALFCLLVLVQLIFQPVCCTLAGPTVSSSSSQSQLIPSPSSSLAPGDSICSSCKGDNSTCRVVSGIFSRPQLNTGYNLVAHIPRGACNLTITEIRKSPNHLALQRRDTTFILNGDWRLSQTGDYPGAGTIFSYKRQDLKSPESVLAPGPLTEPIDLMVLYQQPNPVIKYEYLIPGQEAPQGQPLPPVSPLHTPPQSSHHHLRHSSLLSAATSRPASYVRYPPPLVPSNLLLPQQHPPSPNSIAPFPQKVNPEEWTPSRRTSSEKKFSWKIITFTNCSEPCGGGLQRPIWRCVRHPANNPVNDRRCSPEPKPLSQPTRCNLKPCPAEWIPGEWSSCQGDCGEGYRTRSISCQQRVSPTLKMAVPEAACLNQKPEIRTICQLPRPCNHWTYSEWSQCSAKCGSGVRQRSVYCRGVNGDSLREEECNSREKPADITPCNMGPCEGVDWFVSEWSPECSQKCGTGVQTRHVVCSSLNPLRRNTNAYYYQYQNSTSSQYAKKRDELESNLIDDNVFEIEEESPTDLPEMDVECDEERKPKNERECFSDRGCGEYQWFTGPWGQCSSSCGQGLKSRQVLCVVFSRGKFKVSQDSTQCPDYTKPVDKEECNAQEKCPQRWFTTEWSECSALCGGGIEKRSVSCRAGNWSMTSSLCFDKDRPIDRRVCNEQRCSERLPTTQSTFKVWSNDTGMFRDGAGGVLPSPGSSLVRPSEATGVGHDNRRVGTGYRPRGQGIEEETGYANENLDEDTPQNCTDEYRNCALVVQARLCRYKYYRSVCCSSCLDASS